MAFDAELAERVRGVLEQFPLEAGESWGEIKMFGGLCFTLNGKMTVGLGKLRLMIRLSDVDSEEAMASDLVEPMDFTGKPLKNFAYVKEEGFASDEQLLEWIRKSATYVRTLPDKPKKPRKK
ncbi:MAG: hypothetical protein BGO01_18850 [Armatimonadetes bacterium 55-13]|nr:MAG: hypothetical protein BGO01_18850 [Armatimonadetes bacterium 55-13]